MAGRITPKKLIKRIIGKGKKEKVNEIVEDIVKEVEDTGKDVDELKEDVEEIKEEVVETGKDVEEIKEDVEEIQKHQRSILQRISERILPEKFHWDDLAQQIVGAIILSTPLAVTQEVWILAQALDLWRLAIIIGITLLFDVLLIFYTKYQIVEMKKFLGIPTRLLSLIFVSYVTAAIMLTVVGVIGNQVQSTDWAIKLVIFVGLFANIGAGTADILK